MSPSTGPAPKGQASCRHRPAPVRDGQQAPPHRLAQRNDWPWLPNQTNGTLAAHPYCKDCGQVKAVGSARALDRGGLVNLIARLGKLLAYDGLKLTEVQRRLILKRLIEGEADDAFGLTKDRQVHLVAETAATYTGLQKDVLASYLHAC